MASNSANKEILRNQLAEKRAKLDELNEWLFNHIRDPDFRKKLGERENLIAKIAGLEFKLQQLDLHRPANGYGENITVKINGNQNSLYKNRNK